MKKFFALVLTLTFASLLIMNFNQNENYSSQGDADLKSRVSESLINKNVNDSSDKVVYLESSGLETGSANIVTSIVANYRSFDTLGEVSVLFISALGVSLLLRKNKKVKIESVQLPNGVLRIAAPALFPIMLMVGVVMSVHGHLTPGGGFPGGAIIALSILLMYLSDNQFKVKVSNFKLLEGTMGFIYIGLGLVGLFTGSYFLENFLDTGTVGELFSAGIIPFVYVVIALKVGSELTTIVDEFLNEEGI
jgi:multicomponent Na+:H+ antiporter subunit B